MASAGTFCRLRAVAVIIGLATGAACGGSPVQPEPTLEVVVSGRLERGLESRLELYSDGDLLPASEVVWSVIPEEAATVTADGDMVLLQAGEVTIVGTAAVGTAERLVTVTMPPLVLFDKLVDGNRDIWAIALDGADLRRLTTHPGDDSDPSAAAGIATFVSYRDGSADLYSVPVAGGADQRLTTSSRHEIAPSMAADGRRVAYTSDMSGVTKLWTLDIASELTEPVELAAPGDADIHASPSWWSSSDSIVFVSTAQGGADIHLVRIASGVTQIVAGGARAEVEPAIAPDGGRIVFVSNRDGNDELYLVTLATGESVRLTDRAGSDANPAWLADGRIVYTVSEGGETSLYWLDPADPTQTHPIPGTEGGRRPTGT